jgi:glutamine synthetase
VAKPLAFIATCDLVALVRGRSLFRDGVLNDSKNVGWVPADLSLNAFGGINDDNPYGSVGDLRLLPDLSTEVTLPGIHGQALSIFLANQVLPDGSPWDSCPRSHAQNSIHQLFADHGIELVASFEHEFTLTNEQGSPEGSAFGLDSFRIAEPFGSELVSILESNGLEPENWLAEYGSRQFEITVKPAPALVAADRAILLREIVRDTARRHGMRASFVPLPSIESVGNGVHVHLSFKKDGKQITFDATAPGNLSMVASQAAAGILKHAAALQAWTAPSQISALRLKPHRWSSAGIFAAVQDREALLRICPVNTIHGADPSTSFNIEYRAADASANPWLVISVLARSISSGISAGKPLDRIYTEPIGEGDTSVPLLPEDLNAAIIALQADDEVLSWFSHNLLEAHLGIRRSEAEELEGLTANEKCERYSRVY